MEIIIVLITIILLAGVSVFYISRQQTLLLSKFKSTLSEALYEFEERINTLALKPRVEKLVKELNKLDKIRYYEVSARGLGKFSARKSKTGLQPRWGIPLEQLAESLKTLKAAAYDKRRR